MTLRVRGPEDDAGEAGQELIDEIAGRAELLLAEARPVGPRSSSSHMRWVARWGYYLGRNRRQRRVTDGPSAGWLAKTLDHLLRGPLAGLRFL